MKLNFTLYNCTVACLPPDWRAYDAIEVHPCTTDGKGNTTALDAGEEHLAEFWTVYGHLNEGGVEAITDVSTRKLAETIAARFERALIAQAMSAGDLPRIDRVLDLRSFTN